MTVAVAKMKRANAYLDNDHTVIAFVAAFAGVFWSIRWYYWSTTFEEPFSDIADYVVVARQIVSHFSFGISDTQYSYFTPVTPSFIAISIVLGGDNYQWAFRYLVQTVTFFGSLLLAYEVVKLTGQRWLGAALLIVVTLSRASIFWSLKLGTESVSEALLICSIAASLRAIRIHSRVSATVAGVACMLLALNRPQFVPSVFAVAACFGLAALEIRISGRTSVRSNLVALRDKIRLWQCACFVAGAALVWSPWIARNYLHYGAFIPTATSGIEAFVWESGAAPLQPGRYQELHLGDGTVFRNFGITAIREDLANSPNDYERSKKFRLLATAWLSANWMDLPDLFARRLIRFATHNGASGLTKVPREQLFPPSSQGSLRALSLESILLDKTPWICLLAVGGILVLIGRSGLAAGVVAGLTLLPWFVLSTLIGYERTVESLISITVWLAVYFFSEAALFAWHLCRPMLPFGKEK